MRRKEGREGREGQGCVCSYGGRGGEGRVLCGQGLGLGESPACRSRQKAPCLKLLPPLIYNKHPVEPPHAGSVWLHVGCWAGTGILQLLLNHPGSWPPPCHWPDSINGCKKSVITQMVRRAMHLYSRLELLFSPQTTPSHHRGISAGTTQVVLSPSLAHPPAPPACQSVSSWSLDLEVILEHRRIGGRWTWTQISALPLLAVRDLEQITELF